MDMVSQSPSMAVPPIDHGDPEAAAAALRISNNELVNSLLSSIIIVLSILSIFSRIVSLWLSGSLADFFPDCSCRS